VKLSAEQWQRVRPEFAPPAATPSEERGQIRTAIALFETIVGAMTGTASDKGGNWRGFGLPGQMDCIDESTNTTIYLRMLQKYGLLRWHSVADRATRWSLFSWPHTTAVIEERASRRLWAVDSWFLDNGEPPFVLRFAGYYEDKLVKVEGQWLFKERIIRLWDGPVLSAFPGKGNYIPRKRPAELQVKRRN